ncbi:tetratricopeptide repeat protein [Flammeovirga pacifica]|uniref:Uncharacterized protein n=1 Tax=Flammeovirga pacifica TaxID=915059 RepID=A0A1S1Z509_FLAPC|nr:tetratricopeptide repeat protein [Flammeovirga pacifica]OHX68165.1 hypothetical protein NH26_18340 [Flammeovirga pacifica]
MTKLYSLLFIIFLTSNLVFAQETPPNDYFVKGEVYAKMGKFPEAIMAYEVAIAKDPKNAKYTYAIAMAYLKSKKKKEATEYFNKTVEIDFNNLDAHLKLALLAKDAKNYDSAVEHLDAAFKVSTDPDRQIAYKTRIINLLDKTGNYKEAGPHLEDAKSVQPQNSYILYMDAKYHNYITKNHEMAKASMQTAINMMEEEKGKAHDHYYYELGFAHHSLEEYENAYSAFNQVTNNKIKNKASSMSPEYQYQLALCKYQMYELEESEKTLEAVIKMNKAYEPAYDLLIELKENTLDRREVVTLLEHKVSIQIENTQKVKILADLIDLEIKFGDIANAKKHIKEFEQCDIPLPDVKFMEAIIAYKEEKYDDALEKLNTLKNSNSPKIKYKSNFLMGMIQINEKKYEEAKTTFSSNFPAEFNIAAKDYLKWIKKENSLAKKN